MWNAVRGRVDDLGAEGLFLLTGSSTPEDDQTSHTGARRIAPRPMRTMTSSLSVDSPSGAVSVGELLAAGSPAGESHGLGVAEAIEALAIGGWPDNLDLSPLPMHSTPMPTT